jgi:hypothetical protein
MVETIWADVVGYEGIYEVSNNGLVRTKTGKTTVRKDGTIRTWQQRVLKQRVDDENFHRVNLWKDGKPKTFLVHRLVAEAFIPMVDGKDYVNHKDGDRYNNNVSNLEWCNHEENNNHAFDNNLINTGHCIKLVDIESGKEFTFRSKSKASEFLGRNQKFISNSLNKGKNEVDGYKIEIL